MKYSNFDMQNVVQKLSLMDEVKIAAVFLIGTIKKTIFIIGD